MENLSLMNKTKIPRYHTAARLHEIRLSNYSRNLRQFVDNCLLNTQSKTLEVVYCLNWSFQ